MNEFFGAFRNDVARIWTQLSATQRMLIGAVGVAAVALLTFLVIWAQSPNYVVLFSKLSDQDAGAILSKLKDQNIPYEVDGTAIKVPSNQVHEIRLSMASAGLPAGGTVGFEQLFDKGNNWSATDFTNNLNYQRGLEGELERTIGAIDGVDHARVHIVIPKESLFLDNQEDTTSSVLLSLLPMAHLDLNQIKTIQHLISKAVPNLKEKNVFVTDTTGRDYSDEIAQNDPASLAGTDLSSRQLEIKRKYEQELQRKLQSQLDDTLGVGNAVVRVNTTWDFSQLQTDAEIYTPSIGASGGIMLSEKFKHERYNGELAGKNGGVPGANPNVAPSYQVVTTNGGGGNYLNDEGTHNYDVNKEVQRRVKEPAVLRDTSVSVAFNPPANLNPQGIQSQSDSIAKMVGAAAGIADYKNKVFVNPMRFNTSSADDEAKAMADASRWAAITKWGTVLGAIVLALLALFFLLASFKRRRQDEALDVERAFPRLPTDDLGITLIDDEDSLLGRMEKLHGLPLSADDQRLNDIQKELIHYIKGQPKDAAKLVLAWMNEEE